METKQPLLLVSVCSSFEAEEAWRGGCDLLDVKDPTAGSLGRATYETWRRVEQVYRQYGLTSREGEDRGISVAMGELLDQVDDEDWQAIPPLVRWFKWGVAGCGKKKDWVDRWCRLLQNLKAKRHVESRPILAAYADADRALAPSVWDVLRVAQCTETSGVLVDTWDKSGGGLLAHLSLSELTDWIGTARECGLLVAVAGRLTHHDLALVAAAHPHIIAVRSAACKKGQRTGKVDASAVAQLKEILTLHAQQLSSIQTLGRTGSADKGRETRCPVQAD
ncbi:MAG: hypothetical protein KatS3mg113_0915 [Planctomycetaceae bacterium]|nr:MAG: hypothetical protein KatS3mg113_0915 [Planctomycetaceae bacterium]